MTLRHTVTRRECELDNGFMKCAASEREQPVETVPLNSCVPRHTGFRMKHGRTSLVVQWPRLCAPNAGALGSIPGRELDPTYHN